MPIADEIRQALASAKGAPDPCACEWAVYGALARDVGLSAPGLERLAEHAVAAWMQERGFAEGLSLVGYGRLEAILEDLEAIPSAEELARWIRWTAPGESVAELLNIETYPGHSRLAQTVLRYLLSLAIGSQMREGALETVHEDLAALRRDYPISLLREALQAYDDGEGIDGVVRVLDVWTAWPADVAEWLVWARCEAQGLDVEPLRAALKDLG